MTISNASIYQQAATWHLHMAHFASHCIPVGWLQSIIAWLKQLWSSLLRPRLQHSEGFQEMMGADTAHEQLSIPQWDQGPSAVAYLIWQSAEAGNHRTASAPYTLPHIFSFTQRQIAVCSSNQREVPSAPHCALCQLQFCRYVATKYYRS